MNKDIHKNYNLQSTKYKEEPQPQTRQQIASIFLTKMSIPIVVFLLIFLIIDVKSFLMSDYKKIIRFQLNLNRIFFEIDEIEENKEIHLNKDDYRYKHITKILKASIGDNMKIGIIDHGIGTATLKILPSSSSKSNLILSLDQKSDELISTSRPLIDIILAVPRPLRLERLLPVLSMMGIGKIILIDAEKVEKDYFGSHLFRRPEAIRAGFIEGLSQSDIDCNIPELLVRRRFKKFMINELNELFPSNKYTRLIAHPVKRLEKQEIQDKQNKQNIQELERIFHQPLQTERVVLAIGPEGGWTEKELNMFTHDHQFRAISVGERVLRTDVAVPTLLGIINEYMAMAAVTTKNDINR